MGYDVFISYSHSADQDVAIALERGLERLAKPWHKRRALDVFRDDSELGVNPHLWSSIEVALNESAWYLLLASPEAAESEWVAREASTWMAEHDPDRVLVALTGGNLVWDATRGSFDPDRSTALPPALSGAFGEEPRYLDFRWAHTATDLDQQNAQFMAAVADLAAPVHGISKGELIGEDVRQYKRTRRLAWGALALVLTLAVTAGVAGLVAFLANERLGKTLSELDAAEVRLSDAEAAENAAQQATVAAELQREDAAAAAAAADEAAALAAEAAADAVFDKERADAAKAQAEVQKRQAEVDARVAAAQAAAARRLAANAEALAVEAERSLDDAKRALADANDAADEAAEEAADARAQRDRAESDAIAIDLATKVSTLVDSSPAVAHLLAVQSNLFAARLPNASATAESANALVEAIFSNPSVRFFFEPGLGAINDVGVTPSGILVASAVDGDVAAWDLSGSTGNPVFTDLAPLDSDGPFIRNVALARDGSRVAYARQEDDHITVVELGVEPSTRDVPKPGPRHVIRDVGLAGKRGQLLIATYSDAENGAIHVWDLDDDSGWMAFGRPTRDLAVSADGARVAAYDPHRREIVAWSLSRTGAQPELDARLVTASDRDSPEAIVDLEFLPTGNRVAAVDRAARVMVWSLDDCPGAQACLPTLTSGLADMDGGHIESMAVGPHHIAIVAEETVLRGNVRVLMQEDLSETGLAFSTNYGALAVAFANGGEDVVAGGRRNRLELRSLEPSDPVPRTTTELSSRSGSPMPLTLSDQGDKVLAATPANELELITIDGSRVQSVKLDNPHRMRIAAMRFSADGKSAVSADIGAQIFIWRAAGDRLEADPRPRSARGGLIGDIVFAATPGDAWYAAIPASPRRVIDVFRVGSGDRIRLDNRHDVHVAARHPDGLLMLAGPRGSAPSPRRVAVSFWDPVADGGPAPIGIFVDVESSGATPTSLVTDPQGTTAALGMSDGRIHLIDIRTRQQLAPLDHPTRQAVVALAVSERGMVVGVAAGGEIGVWDASTGRLLGRLVGQRGTQQIQVESASNGFVIRTLDTANHNVWHVAIADLRDRACTRANRNLTIDEWRIHIGDVRPYAETCADLA